MHILGRFAALLPLILTACSTTPQGPGPSGTIYYNTVSDGFIYSMALPSASETKLLFGNHPNRTAQGTFIYVNGTDLAESADGVQVRTIIPFNADIPKFDNGFQFPQLSPDGQFIVYNTNDDLVYVCRRDSGQIVSHFTENPPGGGLTGWERPSWTPDGRIVVAGQLGTPGLWISDANWTQFSRFDPSLNQPSFAKVSPKGDLVAFIANDHIYTIKLDGTGLTQITTGNSQERLPTWAPDGTSIAAFSGLDVITIGVDGTNLKSEQAAFPDKILPYNTDQQFEWQP